MRIQVKNLSFGFGDRPLFQNLSFELGDENPTVILGPSGCGKTTLLRLLAGLLVPAGDAGEITRISDPGSGGPLARLPDPASGGPLAGSSGAGPWEEAASFVFQESRLLPWLTVLDNTALPIRRMLGKEAAAERARHFLDLVSLGDKAAAYPAELSGGQKQRASMARAFAYPAPVLFMDEPFQSLDIPLRIELMDLTLALLEQEGRLAAAVTHDPREAVYLGRRILILGRPPGGILLDEKVTLSREERAYGAAEQGRLEARLLAAF
jgi:NitT/TauT family transport system ATP-binding protein